MQVNGPGKQKVGGDMKTITGREAKKELERKEGRGGGGGVEREINTFLTG